MTAPRAFTIVETLVAITVMTLAILAPFAAIQSVVSASKVSSDQLVAASLAQEGLEYVRFTRDNNYLAYESLGGSAYQHIVDGMTTCKAASLCTIDPSVAPASAISACSGTSCSPLQWDATNKYYTQRNVSNPTVFTRSMYIIPNTTSGLSPNTGGQYETAYVTVSWNDHGAKSMTLTENFYDWL